MKGYSVLLFVPAKHEKSGKPDLNRRPQVPQTCTLTNCAIARFYKKDMFDINDELLLCQVHACHHAEHPTMKKLFRIKTYGLFFLIPLILPSYRTQAAVYA